MGFGTIKGTIKVRKRDLMIGRETSDKDRYMIKR